MSFILDALKKLEKEKESRSEPGVVMVGPVPWGGADPRRWRRRLALAAAAVVLVGAVGIWWLSVSPGPSAPGSEGRKASSSAGSFDQSEAGSAEAPAPAPQPSRPPAEGDTDPTLEEATRAVSETVPAAGEEPSPPAPVADAETPSEDPVDSGLSDAPASPTSASGPEFRLTAISTREGEPIALLNDRLVREGDRFGDVHVIRIGTTEIEIEVDGERRTIGF